MCAWDVLLSELESAADEEKASQMSAYMKNKFTFLGIATPLRRKICRPFFCEARHKKKIDWDFVDLCWEKAPREYQYIAVDYLRAMEQFLVIEDLYRLQHLIQAKPWWDTVDSLSSIVGRLGLQHSGVDEVMLEWSRDSDLWLRRTAIIHQRLRRERMNTALLEKVLLNNLGETEFFINKAMGWILRDYSKTNPQWVHAFIEENRSEMAALSIREGSKYLS